MKPKRQRRTKGAKGGSGPPPAGRVWEAADNIDLALDGYYITEGADLDRPIAYIDGSFTGDAEIRELAARIAADPDLLDNRGSLDLDARSAVFDLRQCGRPFSTERVPGFVFGLKCRPLHGRGPAREPRPFCRFLMEELCDRGGYALLRQVGTVPESWQPAYGWEMRRPKRAKKKAALEPLRVAEPGSKRDVRAGKSEAA